MVDNSLKAVIDRRLMFETLLSRSAEREARDDTVVFWVYRDNHDQWCVRQEGGQIEASFSNRTDALGFVRGTAQGWGHYKLFLELPDGRVTCELCKPSCRSSA